MALINRTTEALAFSTSQSFAIPAVASGNSLLIIVQTNSTMTPSAMTDNGGGSPTYENDVAGEQLEGTSSQLVWIFRRNNITTAPTQISFTTASNALGRVHILEYDNLDDATFLEFNKATRAFATSNTATVTTDTPNQIGIAAIGMGSVGDRNLNTSSSGWSGGHPGDTTDTAGRIFDNEDLGDAGSESFVGTNDGAQWIVAAMWTYGTTSAAQEAAGDGDLAFELSADFAGSGAVTIPGIESDLLKEPNEADQAVANASNVTVRIWHGSTISGAPDEVLTSQEIADGVLSFRAAVDVGDPISYQARWTVTVGEDTEDRFFEVLNATAVDLNA